MLESMRKGSQHIVVKILFFLLALSFIIWGIGDIFRGNTGHNYIATVGKTGVTPAEIENTVREEVSRYQQITGQRLSEDEINKIGLKKYALDQLIRNKTIFLRANELNLLAGKKIIAQSIYNNEIFFNDKKVFDRETFNSLLRSNGFTEESFVNSIKRDYATRTLMENISMTSVAPGVIATEMFKFRGETRLADLLILPPDSVKEIPEPSETDLVQFYNENQNNFAVPEQRAITYISFNANKIKSSIKLSNEELLTEYQRSINQYKTEESRDVSQYLFATEEEARTSYDKISKHNTKEYTNSKMDLGKITKSGVPLEVAETVFLLGKGEISKPVKSQMGWHIFVLNNIEEAKTKSFDEVKASIEKDLLEKRISDEFARFGNEIEDEFAAGKTMEDVAKKFDITVHKIASIDSTGNDNNRNKVINLPDSTTLLPLAFTLEVGKPSNLTLLSDNNTYAIIQVDSISPQRIKALDETRGNAITLWKNQKKIKMLQEKAKEIAGKINSGEDIKTISNKFNLKQKPAQLIKRPANFAANEDSSTPVLLSRELFNLKKVGNATGAYRANDGSFVIGILKEIKNITPANNKNSYLNTQAMLEDEMRNDIVEQYLNFLQKQFKVSIKTIEESSNKQ